MNFPKQFAVALIVFLFFCGAGTSTGNAGPIPLSRGAAGTIVEGTVPDSEAWLLSSFFGFSSGESLAYHSEPTLQGSVATLSGSYLGQPLNVALTFDTTAFPSPGTSGEITYTSSGTYGSSLWSGSGSALLTLTQVTAGTFLTVDLMSSLTIDAQSGNINAQITGELTQTAQPARFQLIYTNTLNLPGTILRPRYSLEVPFEGPGGNELLDIPGETVFSDIEASGIIPCETDNQCSHGEKCVTTLEGAFCTNAWDNFLRIFLVSGQPNLFGLDGRIITRPPVAPAPTHSIYGLLLLVACLLAVAFALLQRRRTNM